ncbi:hypothetical protein 7F23_42 [uncultured Caudovirales phage]|uniref:Uncharacterized protein n=1 Tax=uncultured Caudovirales phage TaxID=2100421 RepID=A0A2H4J253_9CAUD|nr:hypothetical protein 7F23_42 [uncultured Caudovirales phage]
MVGKVTVWYMTEEERLAYIAKQLFQLNSHLGQYLRKMKKNVKYHRKMVQKARKNCGIKENPNRRTL